ncbi:hypothetical protein FOL47_005491 [Perkinsus chesapeaki]|uniref:Reverse transcriptase domain-containing protein n=1 Tax=Perkinsus chesapeaki TaxID=330153 RepID=A0A7J6LXM4_PERCH|nr:hypothetical protein FOL47_005491 [Perkinsus chesapeaki]
MPSSFSCFPYPTPSLVDSTEINSMRQNLHLVGSLPSPTVQVETKFKSGFGLDFPPPGARYPDLSLSQKTVLKAVDEVVSEWGLVDVIYRGGRSGNLSPGEQTMFADVFEGAASDLRSSLCSLLGCENRPAHSGAPFRAPLWSALADLFGDQVSDASIYKMLDEPFPAGILNCIPVAGNLPTFSLSPSKLAKEPVDFRSAFVNYASAESLPKEVYDYIQEELKANRMEIVPPDEIDGVVISRVAAIPKPTLPCSPPSWRLVEDYRRSGVNRKITPFTCPETLALPSLSDLKAVLKYISRCNSDRYVGFQLDFQRAYRHCVVAKSERSFLCISSPASLGDGRPEKMVVRHRNLPFGLRSSGVLWTRVASALGRLLFRMFDNSSTSMLGFLYIDDLTLFIPSSAQRITVARVLLLTQALGLWISWQKVVLNSFTWKVLGFNVSVQPTISINIPADKITSTVGDLERLLHQPKVTLSQVRRIVGRLTWFSQVLTLVKPYLQRFHALIGYMDRTVHVATVGKELRKDIRVWLAALENTTRPIFAPDNSVSRKAFTACDACTFGLGGFLSVCQDNSQKTWFFRLSLDRLPGPLRRALLRGHMPSSMDMTVLELLASGLGVVLSTRYAPKDLPLHLFTDNSAAAHCLRKCYSSKKRMSTVLRAIATLLSQEDRAFDSLSIHTLASKQNFAADQLSRIGDCAVPTEWEEVDALDLVSSLPWREVLA